MNNKFNFEKMKEMMELEVTSKSLKDNLDNILKAMVDLPSRALKIIVEFKELNNDEFKQVTDCVKKYEGEAEYNIVGTMDIEYQGAEDKNRNGRSEFIYMYTEDFDTPVLLIDSLNKRFIIHTEEIYMNNLDKIKEDITQTSLVGNNVVNCIIDPVKEILGEDHPILKRMNTYYYTEIQGQLNESWNPCEATAEKCIELDLSYSLKIGKKDVDISFDDMACYMSLLSNLDLLSVYQAERGVKQVSDTLRYNLMKLSMTESLPVDSILRDHKLLREVKKRTLKALVSEYIAKNELIEEKGLPSSDDSYSIADFINEYNRIYNLCITSLFLELDIEPNVTGFKSSERVLEIFKICKEMYIDFINKLLSIDINTLTKDGGFASVYHYLRQKASMFKYEAAKSMHSEISELLEQFQSREDSDKIESGEIKLS